MNMQKQIAGTNFVIADSIPKIEWKITNENRNSSVIIVEKQ
jgi:hypothetical protein